MKIKHQISNLWNEGQVEYLKNYGLNIKTGHDVFQMDEDDNYFKLKEMLARWGASDWVGTVFDKNDLKNAEHLNILSKWLNDYPQPENNYKETCFDLSNYCSDCGIGKVQKAPLRLKRDPNWGKKQTFSLNWILDEIFVRKDYYDEVLKPLGVDSMEVMLHKKDTPSETTVQLKIPVSNSELELLGYPMEECTSCRRKKYLPITRGFFPNFMLEEHLSIFKSKEYFGSGGAADNKIIVSNQLYKMFSKDRVNVAYHPIKGLI
ncbi:MAG: hypothetical protein KI791_22000 [Cyclobacteriaceae bacterium]|nr:hypothetical protein [Cyclobacteriaceae bacterium SS2]